MDNYTKSVVFVGSTYNEVDEVRQTTTYVYVLTKDFIIWKYNEKQFYVNLPCFLCLVCAVIIGIIGNAIVLFILCSKMKRNNTITFTIWLSASDLIGSFLLLFELYDKRLPMYSGQNIVLCKCMRFLAIFMNSVSAFFLLCIAFDRYFKVCKPLKRMSRQKVKAAIISAFAVSAVCVWPMALFHGPEKKPTKFDGVYGTDCADDDQYTGTLIKKIFFLFVMLTILISIGMLIVLYSFIFHAILRWKRDPIGESLLIRTDKGKNRKWNSKNSCSFEMGFFHSISKAESRNATSNQVTSLKRISDNEVNTPAKASCDKDNNNSTRKELDGPFRIVEKFNRENLKPRFSNHSNSSSVAKEDKRKNEDNQKDNLSVKSINMKCKRTVIKRVSSNGSQKRSTNRSTIMFSVVSLLYILSFLPTVVVEAGNAFGAVYEAKVSMTFKQLVVVANLSYFLNGSINPIVYFVFNKSYRTEIYKMIMLQGNKIKTSS